MKKSKLFIALAVLVAMLATFTLTACNGTAETFRSLVEITTEEPESASPYLPLFDENGIYSEENFAYNMSLEKENGLTLIKNGTTDYVIVTAKEPSQRIAWAAEDLAKAFEGICGSKPQIVDDDTQKAPHEIVLGKTSRDYKSKLVPQDFGAYYIDTCEECLYICGPSDEGTSNGVYGFMEDTLGCVFISMQNTYYPALNRRLWNQYPAFGNPNSHIVTLAQRKYGVMNTSATSYAPAQPHSAPMVATRALATFPPRFVPSIPNTMRR